MQKKQRIARPKFLLFAAFGNCPPEFDEPPPNFDEPPPDFDRPPPDFDGCPPDFTEAKAKHLGVRRKKLKRSLEK
jgi:hypothetical protein